MSKTTDYISQHAKGAVWGTLGTGILPETVLCQSAIESGLGTSLLASKYNNYFGIKAGTAWKGKTVTFATKEFLNGQYVTIYDKFRAYDSFSDSVKDYILFLRSNKRYVNVFNQKDIYNQLVALKVAGYATAPNYVSVIYNVYTTNKEFIVNAIKTAKMNIWLTTAAIGYFSYRIVKKYLPQISSSVK